MSECGSLTFVVPLGRYQLKNDRLHRGDVAESDFGNVQGTDDVRPPLVVGLFERAVPRRTQLATHSR